MALTKFHVGDKTGRLWITENLGRRPGPEGNETWWACLCECGQEVEIANTKLYKLKTCGRCDHSRFKGDRQLAQKWDAYITGARKRRLLWQLSPDVFKRLLLQACFYCTILPKEGKTNGIDRIENNKGYLPGNVVSCCMVCNRAKKDLSLSEFEAWLNWVRGTPKTNLLDELKSKMEVYDLLNGWVLVTANPDIANVTGTGNNC